MFTSFYSTTVMVTIIHQGGKKSMKTNVLSFHRDTKKNKTNKKTTTIEKKYYILFAAVPF